MEATDDKQKSTSAHKNDGGTPPPIRRPAHTAVPGADYAHQGLGRGSAMKIKRLEIAGFRSLRKVAWTPGNLNVVIGPNGSGKSNLLGFFELLALSAQGKLGRHIQSLGGMEPIVWDGAAKSIKFILETVTEGVLHGPEEYLLELARFGGDGAYRIENELLSNQRLPPMGAQKSPFKYLERRLKSSVIFDEKMRKLKAAEEFISPEESLLSVATGPFNKNRFIPPFQKALAEIKVYHDLRTDKDAEIRKPTVTRMDKQVETDGQNLVAVLHTLYTGDRDFKRVVNASMYAAFGADFDELVFPPASDQRIQLRIRWKSLRREQSAAVLSDGTLRFLFLLTVLANPDLPAIVAIDEPEMGLHPSMLPIIAAFAVDAAKRSQIILTTHSPQFLDAFGEDRPTTTVAKCVDGETFLKTLQGDELIDNQQVRF